MSIETALRRVTTARFARLVGASVVVVGLLAHRPAVAQDSAGGLPDTTQPAETRPDTDAGRGASRLGARAFVRGEYSSNLYHVQQRRLSEFQTDDAPGQRFHRMHGPWDFVTQVGLEGRYRLKVAKRRRFGASVGGSYRLHARNGIANYLELWLGLRYDLTKRDHLRPRVSVIPRRFRKNYHEDGAGGDLPFVHAYYSQVYPQLTFSHEFTKSWSTDLVYRVRLRRFEEPMANHSETRHEAVLRSRHRISKRVDFAVGAGVGLALTPNQLEGGGFSVDRSYQTLRGSAKLALRLWKRFETGPEAEYRYKVFTTDEAADAARHGRRDHRIGLGVYARQGIGQHFDVEGGVSWQHNYTNRSDPQLDADAFDYEELLAGVGVRLSL